MGLHTPLVTPQAKSTVRGASSEERLHETKRAALSYGAPVSARLVPFLLLLVASCRSATGPGGLVREGTPPEVDIVRARERGLAQAFTWEEYGPDAFARAKREGRYVLIDGAAEWCHWCHVMDETTYRDPEVGRILHERFVTIRVDVDARPDLEERWSDWGWPATILL